MGLDSFSGDQANLCMYLNLMRNYFLYARRRRAWTERPTPKLSMTHQSPGATPFSIKPPRTKQIAKEGTKKEPDSKLKYEKDKGLRMSIKDVIRSQYHASLEMLKGAICRCPDSLWDNKEDKIKFWHVCFHVIFYTHLYLQDSEREFRPWTKHRDQYQFLGSLPWSPYRAPRIGEAYTKEEILEYLEICRNELKERIDSLNLDGESGFEWLTFNKLELQLYNIRHIQHHAGQLIYRLRLRENIEVEWIGMMPD